MTRSIKMNALSGMLFLGAILMLLASLWHADGSTNSSSIGFATGAQLFMLIGALVEMTSQYKVRRLRLWIFLSSVVVITAAIIQKTLNGMPDEVFYLSAVVGVVLLIFLLYPQPNDRYGLGALTVAYSKRRTGYEEEIVLHRFGTLETHHTAYNQCKDVGHHLYKYVVKVFCENRLDHNGWLIDNRAINAAMKEAVEYVDSCEGMCIHFADVIENLLVEHGVVFHKLHVYIEPIPEREVPHKDFAGFELTRNYQ